MAGGARGERRTALRPDQVIFKVVTGTTFLLMAVTGLGYLALSWSTVVLLGAFVTVLQKKDFWSITVISMIQAARSVNVLYFRIFISVVYIIIKYSTQVLRNTP
uniref:Uncharacterized protein n=1 Tax=Setaria viridis TaxID=4556 RepID=A0A4U6VN45_SETVI|nr:hypothetical protein SEVIR_3G375200v2 [Setaria viridis]